MRSEAKAETGHRLGVDWAWTCQQKMTRAAEYGNSYLRYYIPSPVYGTYMCPRLSFVEQKTILKILRYQCTYSTTGVTIRVVMYLLSVLDFKLFQ